MAGESEDPTVIRSIAVHAEDVVTALEASRRGGRRTVLRVTPPYSGRMRARLHETGGPVDGDPTGAEDGDTDGAVGRPGGTDRVGIHVDPTALVAESVPEYPSPADTEDEIRADRTLTYSRDLHRERHAEAVADWRGAVVDHVVDSVTLGTPEGPHEVEVHLLGSV